MSPLISGVTHTARKSFHFLLGYLTLNLPSVARAISRTTATLNQSECVCGRVHPWAPITKIFSSVCVQYLSLPLPSHPCQGRLWSVEVKSCKSPHCPQLRSLTQLLHPFFSLPSRLPRQRLLQALRLQSYKKLQVLRGIREGKGNYSSVLIGIIILTGWQRWITRQDCYNTVSTGEGGVRWVWGGIWWTQYIKE